MTSDNESKTSKFFSLPPPSTIILSNLANQLILDEDFYFAVLDLAKNFGHSAVYLRKVIVKPCNLIVEDNCHHSNLLECLSGEFLWVPYCGEDTKASEEGITVYEPLSVRPSITQKRVWTKGRKAAYLRSNGEINNDANLNKTRTKLKRSKGAVKINITKDKIKCADDKTILIPLTGQSGTESENVSITFNQTVHFSRVMSLLMELCEEMCFSKYTPV